MRTVVKIKHGWEGSGRIGSSLGNAITLYGIQWSPVLWDGEDDPDWHKTRGLDIEAIEGPNRPLGPHANTKGISLV